MFRPLRLLLSILCAGVLAVVLLPLAAAPASAAPTVVGYALDEQGKPLRHVYWDIYHYEGGQWVGLQFGPKLTDANGQFSYTGGTVGLVPGQKYRICVADNFYGQAGSELWFPDVRHRDTCWRSDATVSTSVDTAQDWTATDGPTTFTMTMPRAGLGMAPVDPFVTGAFEVGKPLTVVGQDGWRPTTATLSYRWFSSASSGSLAPISGATSATYVPTSGDSGKWIQAEVTATLPGYKTARLVSQINKVGTAHAQLTSPLKITGTAAAGKTLTASFGKPAADGYSEISWFVDGVPHLDATSYDETSGTFAVTAAMAGARIEARLSIYLTDAQGNYIDGSSTYGRVVVQAQGVRPPQPLPISAPPAVTTTPVAGTTAVGATLTAPSVTADPAATTTYQWLRDAAPIPGATAPTYRLQPADIGKRISVAAMVARPGWWNGFLRTSTTSAVVQGQLPDGKVKIKDQARAGGKLKAKVGGWKGLDVTYRWLRNGKAIKPAKKSKKATYKVRKKDRGKRITVVVTATKPFHVPAKATSKAKKIRR